MIDLRSMPDNADRTDGGVVERSRLLGMAGVSNPTEVSTLRVNGKSWYEIEEKARVEMKALSDRGDWEFFEHPPFAPLHFNPLLAIKQGEKRRALFNKPAEGELSLNGQAQDCGMAKLKLISLYSICQAIATLQAKSSRCVRGGGNVGLSLSWVDFWAAFNQTGIAPPKIWQNVAGFVRHGRRGPEQYPSLGLRHDPERHQVKADRHSRPLRGARIPYLLRPRCTDWLIFMGLLGDRHASRRPGRGAPELTPSVTHLVG